MYFCFDIFDEDEITVALTCPRTKVEKQITKCCPEGQVLNGTQCVNSDHNWKIQINGHIFSSKDLIEEDKLVHEPNGRSQVKVKTKISISF